MQRGASFLVVAFAVGVVGTRAVAAEEPEGVLVGSADPAIIEVAEGRGGYVVFATGAGLPFYHSSDLVRWRRVGRVFDERVPAWAKKAVPGTRGIWAPDVVRIGDLYHVYYSVSTFGSQRSVIGLTVNRSLDPSSSEYRWEDRGLVLESAPGKTDYNAIDAAVFVDDDGSACILWGSYWTGIKLRELDPQTGKPVPDAPVVAVARQRPPGTDIEAAYVVRHGGHYWLFVSFGTCCEGAKSTYRVMVGRSQELRGPYRDFHGRLMTEGGATLVLAGHGKFRGTGHNSALRTGGRDYLVHHTYDLDHLDRHRVLQIRPLYWGPDGWPLAGEPLAKPVGKGDEAAKIRPERLVGRWEHLVDYDERRVHDVRLLPDGKVGGSPEGARWRLDGDVLTLRWPSESAPGGAWVDRVLVAPGGRSYVGRNQRGQVIRGIRRSD